MYRDGKAEISRALYDKLPHCNPFLCSQHGTDSVKREVHRVENPGKQYTDLVNALTVGKFNQKFMALPPHFKAYLENNTHIEFEGRFLAKFAEQGGRTQAVLNSLTQSATQHVNPRTITQFNEAMMWSALSQGVRDMLPLKMLVKLTERCLEKVQRQQTVALACTSALPPKVVNILECSKRRMNAKLATGDYRVEFLRGSSTRARFYYCYQRFPARYFMVDLSDVSSPTCACGFYELTKFPCECMLLTAQRAGWNDLTVLVHNDDRTSNWQTFYARNGLNLAIPSTAVAFAEQPDNLQLPVVMPNPAGAPRKRRRRSYAEQMSGGRQAGGQPAGGPVKHRQCKKCGGFGHYPKTCKAGSASVLP